MRDLCGVKIIQHLTLLKLINKLFSLGICCEIVFFISFWWLLHSCEIRFDDAL